MLPRVSILFCGALALTCVAAFAVPPPVSASPTRTIHRAGRDAVKQGISLLAAQHYKEAEKAFRLAIKRHEQLPVAYAGLGNAAVGLHDYATALSAYKHASTLQPKNALFQYRTAFTALYSQDYHAAVQYATNYINLKPRDASGFHLRFLAYGSLLMPKQQLKDATQVFKLQPHNPTSLNDLGIALTNNKHFQKAEHTLSQAIKLQPKNPQLWENRALAESLNGQKRSALRDYTQALSLTSDPTQRKQLQATIKALKKAKKKHQ